MYVSRKLKETVALNFFQKVDRQLQLRLLHSASVTYISGWMSDFMLDTNLLFVSNIDVLTAIQTQKLRALQ